MLSLRRSALRILSSSPSSVAYKPRAITSLSQSLLKQKPASRSLYQRRWASDEAPVSKLQATPQEEVENAIHEDSVKVEEAIGESSPQESAAIDAEVQDTPMAYEPPAPAETASTTSTNPVFDASPQDKMKRMGEPKPTVYVGNLFFDVTEDDLKQELGRFGEIEQCRLLRDSRGLSKGFGYVDFATTEAATSAIEALHQQVFEGRRLIVQYAAFTTKEMDTARRSSPQRASQGPKNPPSRTLFIGNMSFEMTDRDLNSLFRGIRNVVDVRVAIDRRTGQPRGFAHADFIDVQSAQEGLKVLHEKEVYGRKLRIDYSTNNSNAPKNAQRPPPTE